MDDLNGVISNMITNVSGFTHPVPVPLPVLSGNSILAPVLVVRYSLLVARGSARPPPNFYFLSFEDTEHSEDTEFNNV